MNLIISYELINSFIQIKIKKTLIKTINIAFWVREGNLVFT